MKNNTNEVTLYENIYGEYGVNYGVNPSDLLTRRQVVTILTSEELRFVNSGDLRDVQAFVEKKLNDIL